ncbi:CBS domain-containing protein [Streptomyces qinglanensis]|uniref:CBS domain-containing protein n=1 Tax=Streptomyces qinglanensis TaxID=943816 RepID=UPI0037A0C080
MSTMRTPVDPAARSGRAAQPPAPRTVGDVMTHTVVAVGSTAGFKQIVRTLREWRVGAVPVLEGDGRVIGVVSEGDLLPAPDDAAGVRPARGADAAVHGEADRQHGSAADLMTSPAVTVRSGTRVREAARTMAAKKLKSLPVIDGDGRLIGIVSRADVLSVYLRSDEQLAHAVREEILTPLSGAVGELRAEVHDGVVTLSGRASDPELVPLVVRTVLALEGVVDVRVGGV